MSIKDLFNKNYVNKVVSSKSLDKLGTDAESATNVVAARKKAEEFIPPIDFFTASNFAFYGSAAKYYEDAIKRIYLEYPYDGSEAEMNEFALSSSYVDKFVLDTEYPRSTGYIILSAESTDTSSAGTYPTPTVQEFIEIKGGPNTDRTSTQTLASSFTGSHPSDNIYNVADDRASNLRFLPSSGSTIEFWMNKSSFPNSQREVVFDLWNQKASTDGAYGRIRIDMSPTTGFHVTYRSGSSGGFANSALGSSATLTKLTDGDWHHYAFSFLSSSDSFTAKLYVNGELDDTANAAAGTMNEVTGALKAYIGALQTTPVLPSVPSAGAGDGKLAASLDEFRFWKKARTSEDIGRNWWTQVRGGANTDLANTTLGVYYKFNEGITGITSIDSNVLDYSGRISNGAWTGYNASARNTGSAIVSASAAPFEFEDPIIHSVHPDVVAVETRLVASGTTHDINNNSRLYNMMPAWIIEEDGGDIENLTQIVGSYFDKLQTQVKAVPALRDPLYLSSSNKPYPFTSHLLESKGLFSTDVFVDANILETVLNRDEDRPYEEDLDDIKNQIYQNIYNNLVHIYKSKGTEKAFRNLIHCYGVGEDLVRLNTYGNNVTYELSDNFRSTVVSKNVVDFSNSDRFSATVYQYTASNNPNSVSFISGTAGSVQPSRADFIPITLESEIIFPDILNLCCGITGSFRAGFVTSSLFGMHSADANEPYETTWPTNDFADLRVVAIKNSLDDTSVRFKLTSSNTNIPQLTSSLFNNVYDTTKWNFAVRVVNEKYPVGDFVTGSSTSGSSYVATPYQVEFYGVNTQLDIVQNEFYLTGAIKNTTSAINLLRSAKRVFAGAHRENFTGSVIDQQSDVKVSSVRYWNNYIPNENILVHARDSEVYGAPSASLNSFLTQDALTGTYLPQAETLALNWSFYDVTGSDASGQFVVQDLSSGSAELFTRYGWVGNILKAQHTGRGDFFPANNQQSVDRSYIPAARQALPEIIQSSEMVKILDRDDENFTRDSRPINYFFSIEKSLYQVISDEMVRMFGSIAEFNRLIGDPINRYRQDYKLMEKVRNIFFEGVDNTPDLDKFIEFYKWIDSSLTVFLMQLIPASANSSNTVRTLVESHILERNKYWSKFPTLEGLNIAPEGITPGPVPETTTLRAPLTDGRAQDPTKHQKFWQEKASRKEAPLSTGDTTFDDARESLRKVIYPSKSTVPEKVVDVKGRLQVERKSPRRVIRGGINYSQEKDRNLVYNATFPAGPVATSGTPLNVLLMFSRDTQGLQNVTSSAPEDLRKLYYSYQSSFRREDETGTKGVNNSTYTSVMKGDIATPFNLLSSSVTTGYNKAVVTRFRTGSQVTNLHSDTTSLTNHVPMQGPFTQEHVGGRQHRHININRFNSDLGTTNNIDDQFTRPEGWQLLLGPEYDTVGPAAMGFVGPDYPATSESTYPSVQREKAVYYRNVRAKRPVNIRNIRHTTSSVNLGNFDKNYQVIQTGRSALNRYFVDNDGVALPTTPLDLKNTLPKTNTLATLLGLKFGGQSLGNYFGVKYNTVDEVLDISNRYEVLGNFQTIERTGSSTDSVIVSRFSAPGGPEVNTLGYLDIPTAEKAVYNALPFRNLSIRSSGSGEAGTIRVDDQLNKRRGLSNLLSLHAGRFGFDPTFGSIPSETYITQPSYQKNNRNTLKRIEFSGPFGYAQNGATTTGSVFDNAYVNFSIPRSDIQYSWITASYEHARILGHAYGESLVSSSAEGVQQAIDFVSASQISSDDVKVDFVGLNSLLVNSINIDTNTLSGALNSSIASLSDTELLNALNLNRNGPYGVNTWTQIRGEASPVARTLRRKNLISYVRKSDFNYPLDVVSSSVVSRFGDVEKYTESPVVSKFSPLIQDVTANNVDPDGKIIQKPLSLASSFANNLKAFTNTELNNKYNVSEQRIQNYDKIKNLYLNNRTDSPDSPVDKFNYLLYRESVYPAMINAYSSSVRVRQNYVNTFWRSNRTDRNRANVFRFGGTIPLESMWSMDARADGTFLTGTITDKVSEHGNPFRTSVIGGSGILQNLYAQIGNALGGNVDAPASPYYARRHDIAPQIRSVVGPEGLDIPETGSGFVSLNTTIPFQVDEQMFGGQALWEAGAQNNRTPWYNSYDDYVSQMRLKGKDYSIVPEFRISDHVEAYVKTYGGDFLADNLNILEMSGGIEDKNVSNEEGFYKTYTNSDFLKFFEVVRDDHAGTANPTSLGLRCKGLLKFLPYNGFYPSERTVELANMFSASYGNYVNLSVTGSSLSAATSSNAAFAAFVNPVYSPGLLYNTIKSGIAVDYPIFTASMDITGGYGDLSSEGGTGFYLGSGFISGSSGIGRFHLRLPFETLVQPENYLRDIDIVNMETHASAAQNCTASWNGDGGPLYKYMASNFFAEVPEFFLPEQQFTSLVSLPESKWGETEKDKVYAARIKVRKSYNDVTVRTGSLGYRNPLTPISQWRTDLHESFTMYSRPSAFGPPVGMGTNIDSLGGFNPSFTPPYYYGESWADVFFTAPRSGSFNISDLLSADNLAVSYIRIGDDWIYKAGSSAGNAFIHTMLHGDNIEYNSMQLDASFNLFGKAEIKSVTYDPAGKPVSVEDDSTDNAWVLQSSLRHLCLTSQMSQ